MRRTKKIRLLALVLAMTMLAPSTAYAAPGRWNSNSWNNNSWNNNSWGNNWNKQDDSSDKTTTTTETELEVVESAETVENPEMLRAATYELTTTETTTTASTWGLTRNAVTTSETTTTVKYFPVTMYDYDENIINDATHKKDGTSLYEGIYFSGGNPSPDLLKKETVTDMSAFVAGKYYIQNVNAKDGNNPSWLTYADDTARGTYMVFAVSEKENASVWTMKVYEDGKYSLSTEINGTTYYLDISATDDNTWGDGFNTAEVRLDLEAFSNSTQSVQISKNSRYLSQYTWGSEYYGDFANKDRSGNAMLFYPVDSEEPLSYSNQVKIIEGYQEWNYWNKATDSNANGDLMYTGLVAKEMVDDELVFNVPDGGIFNGDSTVKDIYEYVGLPFKFKDGYYTFDSDAFGARFNGTPVSGKSDDLNELEVIAPQSLPLDVGVGDGSGNAWFPYATTDAYYSSNTNYHFGMRADIPFSMTANGRIQSTNDNSDEITFSFSGDDDVWVFIDGRLVIDLGGIHNRLDATIDFAANTITYSENNSADGGKTTGSYNNADFKTTQKLFTDAAGKGIIDMERSAFALDEDHTMSVFYLERGKGTSNCKIEFNLPMNDTVLVSKDATQSWYEAKDLVENLTESEQRFVDNLQFGFTLYKKSAEESEFKAVSNTNFYLLDEDGEVIAIRSTGTDGHFYLQNGQTAKFITEIPAEGVTYYVVEDEVPEYFVTPDYNFAGEAAGAYTYGIDGEKIGDAATGNLIPEQILALDEARNKSYEVTVKGSVEANDSVQFICSNYMRKDIPNPTISPIEDVIVIDYGLPVVIEPLANDIHRGDTEEIIYIGSEDITVIEEVDNKGIVVNTILKDEDGNTIELNSVEEEKTFKFGLATLEKGTASVLDESNDTIVYKLTKPLTEVEVLTYVVQATGKETSEAGASITQSTTKVGKIYIVPATTMYYEENFSDLVKFANPKNSENAMWDEKTTVWIEEDVSDYQEPGVVGTVDDSTYGTDVAYLSDSGDSNGTSHFGNTTDGPIRFMYTFTGTSSSIFARASANTGYMQVKLYVGTTSTGSDDLMNITYRDTYYKDQNELDVDKDGVLYNIPVYTTGDLSYGTYTVVVTIAAQGTPTAGNSQGSGGEFYLDGIRIVEPLNKAANENLTTKALTAYETDGESNVDIVTLRYKMITEEEEGLMSWETEGFAVFTDVNGEIKNAEEYKSAGPKEEVYLNKGQSIKFGVKYWHKNGYKLYLGMKAPMGSAEIKSGQSTRKLENTTDCYYDITSDYGDVKTMYEQAKDAEGNLLYTDAEGKVIYETLEDVEGETKKIYRYADDHSAVADGVKMMPKDDTSKPYYVAVYTLTSNDGIVSLTNLKAVGDYKFVLVEKTDLDSQGGE